MVDQAMSDLDYRVTVTREGADWLAQVDGVAPAHTFARNLEALDRYVREAIVLALDLPDGMADDLRLTWDYHTDDPDLDRELAALREDRTEVESQRTSVEERTASFARKLAGRGGFSVRDISAMLGVSRARAQQLVGR
jgi:hypothetical protein